MCLFMETWVVDGKPMRNLHTTGTESCKAFLTEPTAIVLSVYVLRWQRLSQHSADGRVRSGADVDTSSLLGFSVLMFCGVPYPGVLRGVCGLTTAHHLRYGANNKIECWTLLGRAPPPLCRFLTTLSVSLARCVAHPYSALCALPRFIALFTQTTRSFPVAKWLVPNIPKLMTVG